MKYLSILIIVSAAVFLLLYFFTKDLSIAVMSSSCVCFAYILFLSFSSSAKGFSRTERVIFLGASIAGISGIALYEINMYRQSHWQASALMNARAEIDDTQLKQIMQDEAINTIKAFYNTQNHNRKNLDEIFLSKYPVTNSKKKIIRTLYDNSDSTVVWGYVFLEASSPEKVSLIGVGNIARGINDNFQNYNGKKGYIQTKMIIAPGGTTIKNEN